jgi:VanZ family protein
MTPPEIRISRAGWRVLAAIWGLFIFMTSTKTFGSANSNSVLLGLLRFLGFDVEQGTVRVINLALRKSAHAVEFGVFGYLLYRALADPLREGMQTSRAWLAMSIAASYAILDEFHQSFVPGRGASLLDCGIDMAGVLAAILIVQLQVKNRSGVLERS